MDEEHPELTWAGMSRATKIGLAVAFGVIVLPIAVVSIWLYAAGFSDRSFEGNLHYGALLVWIPLLIGLTSLQRERFWRWAPKILPAQREAMLSAIAFGLVFSVVSIKEHMTRAEMLCEYVTTFFMFLACIAAGHLALNATQRLWRAYRGKQG